MAVLRAAAIAATALVAAYAIWTLVSGNEKSTVQSTVQQVDRPPTAATTPEPAAPPSPTSTVEPAAEPIEMSNRVSWLGRDWYLHGANLPWYNWGCDFGCGANGGASSPAVTSAVGGRLRQATDAALHNIRWWIFPGDPWQIQRDDAGRPSGIDTAVFPDIDAALALAERFDVYYTLVLFSGPDALPRSWMADPSLRDALAEVVAADLFRRYADHPHILSWQIFNEPEWQIWSGQVTQEEVVETVRAIVSRAAGETRAYITVGSANLDGLSMWVGVGLGFYQAHWYDPMGSGSRCARCLDIKLVQQMHGIDAPLVIGEYYGGTGVDALARLEDLRTLGYAGAWAWSLMPERTNDQMAIDLAAAEAFAERHDDVGPRVP